MNTISSDFERARLYGIIGVALYLVSGFISIIPYIGGALGFIAWLAGIILVFLAFRELSRLYNKPEIFSYFVKSLIASILTVVIIFVGIILVLILAFGFAAVSRPMDGSEGLLRALIGFFLFLVPMLIAGWILYIVAGYFYYKSTDALSTASGEELFRWSGISALIGALTVVILIGFLFIFVSEILLLIAFLALKPPTHPPSQLEQNPPITPS